MSISKTLPLHLIILLSAFSYFYSTPANAKVNPIEITQKVAETQIRHLLEPLLDKYCHDECKLMSVNVAVDLAASDSLAPGFDDIDIKNSEELAPSSAQVKILMDDKVGPISRSKLLDLVQQYLDNLNFPVKVATQITHFPVPQGSEGKIAELREKISKQFLNTTDELLRQFCPQHCLLADFNIQTEAVNGEEAQYGAPGEFIQDGDTAIKIKDISATLLMDQSLSPDEQANILEMARLKTNSFKKVTITGKSLKFPHPITRSLASDQDPKANGDAKTNSETNQKQEKIEKIEKVDRVENGDAVQAELQKFKLFGLVFAVSILALLIFIAYSTLRPLGTGPTSNAQRVLHSLTSDPVSNSTLPSQTTKGTEPSAASRQEEQTKSLQVRYEIERLNEDLVSIYAQQPKVAKQVFSRILTEEGVETTAECIHIFGEGIVIEMLRDPSLQSDLTELMEFYAKNTIELTDEEKLDLLRKLHNRTIAGKLIVLGNRSSGLFDFLAEMDGLQILELIRTESLTVKSIVLTQCDIQKRTVVYSQLPPEVRMKLLAELSRIDYLPRDFIFNVATALKRKRKENPKLNTEALPGSEVLVSLLERTGQDMQKTIVKNLETTNPDSARTIKSKLVSIDTLRYLRDGQLLEVVLSLKHDELIQFLKGAPADVRATIFSKSPKELVVELEEELDQAGALSRETYQTIERKILNRMKIMSNEGHINLLETNERMFANNSVDSGYIQSTSGNGSNKVPAAKRGQK